jgi:hypothetical protein
MKLKKKQFLESIMRYKDTEIKRETRENSIDLEFDSDSEEMTTEDVVLEKNI